MTTVARFVLCVFFGIAVLGGCTWAMRAFGEGPSAYPTGQPTVVSARYAPVSPRSLPAFRLARPVGRAVARPRPLAGFSPLAAVLAPARPAAGQWAAPPAVRLPGPVRFVGFFLRLVLGHRIAAQAP
jgi:hypothetical protein